MEFSVLRHLKSTAYVGSALAACEPGLHLGRPGTQQPVLCEGDSDNPAQVPGYLAGLVESSLPFAGWMQRNRNQPVGLKAILMDVVGGGKSRGQGARKARMAAVLQLVNDRLDRVLERGPGPRRIETI